MHIDILLPLMPMIHLLILAVHLLAIAKIMRPRGVRAVVAESVLLKHQLVISSRARRRSANLSTLDRFVLAWDHCLFRQAAYVSSRSSRSPDLVEIFAQPDLHFFLKPTVTRSGAEIGLPLHYQSRPNWGTYGELISIVKRIKIDLRDLRPRDMIDIQSFLGVMGSDEYPARSRRTAGSPPERCTCMIPSPAAWRKTRAQLAASNSDLEVSSASGFEQYGQPSGQRCVSSASRPSGRRGVEAALAIRSTAPAAACPRAIRRPMWAPQEVDQSNAQNSGGR